MHQVHDLYIFFAFHDIQHLSIILNPEVQTPIDNLFSSQSTINFKTAGKTFTLRKIIHFEKYDRGNFS